jgi:hypothetical protein
LKGAYDDSLILFSRNKNQIKFPCRLTDFGIMLGCQGLEAACRYANVDMGRAAGIAGGEVGFKAVGPGVIRVYAFVPISHSTGS